MESKALNFQKWIDEHRSLLKPPVGNKQVFEEDDFIVMVVGGPNARTDYHINRAGEIYLPPPRVPQSPQRMANSVGPVIERKRLPHEKDGLQWYCDRCTNLLYEEYFTLHNVEKDFPPIFDRFFADEKKRTCKKCGTVMAPPATAPPRR